MIDCNSAISRLNWLRLSTKLEVCGILCSEWLGCELIFPTVGGGGMLL
jgi:hypothetical protein